MTQEAWRFQTAVARETAALGFLHAYPQQENGMSRMAQKPGVSVVGSLRPCSVMQ